MEYYNGLYYALRNDKPLPVTAEEGLKVIRIIETAFRSVEEKRIVEL
jgi:predicted dehydrogenase